MTEENEVERILDFPLTKQGNSLAVVIPQKVLKALGYEHGDFVRVILKSKNSEL